MRPIILVVGALILATCGCQSTAVTQSQEKTATQRADMWDKGKTVDANMALDIAKKDAAQDFRSLDHFKISVAEDAKGWRVTFEPKDPRANGGGPQYIIDSTTGEILEKVIYQ